MLAAPVVGGALYGCLWAQDPALTKVATVPVNAAQAHDVALVGNRAYVATSAGLTIFDITEITAPVMLGYVFHGGLDGPCTGLEGTPCTHL